MKKCIITMVLLLVLVWGNHVSAAITLIAQATAGGTGTSIAPCITGAGITSGDAFIIASAADNIITSVTDDAGNTWTRVLDCNDAVAIGTGTWYTLNATVKTNLNCAGGVASGTNHLKVTIAVSPSTSYDALLSEWHGIKTSSGLDQHATCKTGNSATASTNSITPTANGSLVYGEFSIVTPCASPATPSGYTDLSGDSLGTTHASYLIQGTAGSTSATWGSCTSARWAANLSSFLAAPATANVGQVIIGQ